MKLYVGNLSYDSSQSQLQDLFGQYGQVQEVALITDRDTGRPKGFGFVTMDDDGGRKAIGELDGKELDGRNIKVNEARPKENRGGGGGWNNGGGGGGGRRGGW